MSYLQKVYHENDIQVTATVFLPFTLASCGDKKESAQSCSIQLDEQKYSKVSENENCSNYERASGYLGQAGMSFANFLKTGATDNLTKTLGISES